MKKVLLLLIVVISIPCRPQTFTQAEAIIYGSVVDENSKSLPYVNVFILNTNIGTTTDGSGKFKLITKILGEILIKASMVGYSDFNHKLLVENQSKIELKIRLKKEIIELQESIIIGSSFGSEKNKGVVLSSQDIYTTPGGAADIFQTLKTLPGLTQVSESAQLFVRGGDPIETLTILDGATLYHPYTYESSYGGLFSNLNTSTVKNIYFSSGGFSSKYGNALSGILDIETKDEPLSTNFMIGVSMAAANLNGEIPIIDEKLGIRFTLQQSFTKPIIWFNGALDEFTSSPSSRDANVSIIYKYSKSGRIKAFILSADDKQGVNVDRAEYDGVFNGNSSNNFINLHHSDILAPNLLVKNSLSYSGHSNKLRLGLFDLTQRDNVLKFRSDVEYQVSKNLKLITGLEIEQRERNYLGVIPENQYDIRPEADGNNIDASIRNYRIAGYAELEFKDLFGAEKLFMVAGSRVDGFPGRDIKWLDPRIGFGYKISEKSTFKIASGTFHQLPDLRLFAPQDGNPNLLPMRSDHIAFSYDFDLNKFTSLRLELYHKIYKNLPLEDSELNYSNDGEGFANGIDFIAKGKFNNGFEGWLSYGFINTKRKWMEFEGLSHSNFDITHNLALVLNYRLAAMWKIGMNYKYATGRPFTPVIIARFNPHSGIYEPAYGKNNSERYPDYHRLDLRITHMNQLFKEYFTIFYIEAINILDITNLFGYSYNPDYSERFRIKSYFGRRTIVLGAQVTF